MRKTCVHQILGLLFVLWASGLSESSSDPDQDAAYHEKPVNYFSPNKVTGKAAFDDPWYKLRHKLGIPRFNGQWRKSEEKKPRKDSVSKMKACAMKLVKGTNDVCPIVKKLGKINRLLRERKVLQGMLNGTKSKQEHRSEVSSFLTYIVKRIELGNSRLKIEIENVERSKWSGNGKEQDKDQGLEENEPTFTRRSNATKINNATISTTTEKYPQITIGLDIHEETNSTTNSTSIPRLK